MAHLSVGLAEGTLSQVLARGPVETCLVVDGIAVHDWGKRQFVRISSEEAAYRGVRTVSLVRVACRQFVVDISDRELLKGQPPEEWLTTHVHAGLDQVEELSLILEAIVRLPREKWAEGLTEAGFYVEG